MRKLTALLLAGLMVVAFAGCSKDKKDNVEASTATTQPAASSSDDEDESESEESESEESESAPASGDCPSQAEVDEVNAAVEEAMASETGGFEQMLDVYDVMGSYVPDELQGDFEILRGAVEETADYYAGLETTDMEAMTPAQQAEAVAALEAMNTPEVQAAGENISQYFASACPEVNFG